MFLLRRTLVFFLFSFSIVAFAQPANNNFAAATDITSLINSCSANAAYTTVNATADQSKGTCWDNGPNYNVWFRFTATATQYMKVQVKVGGVEGSMQNPFVALWNSSLTQLNCQNFQGATTDIETDYYGLTAGQTYYISVDNYVGAGYRGTFTLCLSDVVDYNYFEGARDVTSLINTCSADAAYTTLNATPDRSKGACWDNGPNYNRWFKFTATATQYMKVQVKVGGAEGTMQNPFVALWNSSLTQLSCENFQGATTDIETDYYGLTAGQTYYISVDNYVGAGYRGTFKLCLSDVTDYNFFEGARDVTSLINTCSADAAYSTLNATPDRSKGACWDNGPNYNRWFKFTATATQYMKVQVKVGGSEGTMQNPFVALWNSSLTQLNCQNFQGATTDIETDYYGLTAGQTYYISVDNYVGTGYRGTFTLCLSDVVDYNYFEGARDVTPLINTCSADAAYTTLNATPDRTKGACWDNGPNYNRWFRFTATATQYMKVQVKVGGAEGTMQNPFVALWNSSLTQLSCENFQGATTDIETDYYGLTPGQTYYISVDNYIGANYRGTFKLCLNDVVDYNFFEGARDVTSLINTCSADAAYSTLNATPDRSKGACWDNGPNYNRWFKFTATATQYMKVQVKVGGAEGTMQNPFVALWNSSLTQLNCENFQGATTDIETDYYGLTPGQTYYISVDNYVGSNYRGTFKLCLNDVVDYNFFEGAKDITSLINSCSADAAYSTLNATPDRSKGSCWDNGPNYNRWFKFTATSSQYMKVQVKVGGSEGTMQNPFVALWNSSLTQLNCQNFQGANTDIETDYYGLTPGQTYYISVDNYVGSGYRGTFKLCLSDVTDYNYFEGALDVTGMINGCSTDAAYSTLNATPDRSKGTCWDNGPNYNRWFKFTATSTQYMKVQVKVGGSEGTMQNPFVALWNSSLTQLNCQNFQGANTDIETDYYGLTPGQTYYISVDNYVGSGYRGTFTLCLSDVLDYNFYEGAIAITDLNNWCSADAAYSTLNATPDKNKGSCWSNGPNYNRWFKFTAITPTVTVQVKVGGAEGTMQNPFVALWATNGTTQLACTNYAGASTDISLTYGSLTIGNTYYISVDNYVGSGYRGTFTLCVNSVDPTVFYSRASGAWNTLNTWSNAGYGGAAVSSLPGPGNVVNIRDQAVTVSANASCAEVNISTSTANTSLTIDNATLTVNGRFISTNAANFFNVTSFQNNGILQVANNLLLSRTGGNAPTQINIASGSVTIGQDLLMTSTGGTTVGTALTASGTSSLSVGRDMQLTHSGGLSMGASFNNSATLSVGRDLIFAPTAAGTTAVTFNNTTAMSIRRNIVRPATPYGALTFNNTSSLTFNGVANQQIIPASAGSGGDAITYRNVTINNISGFATDFTTGGVVSIPGNLVLTRGIIRTTSSPSTLISVEAGATVNIGNTDSFIDGPMQVGLSSATPSVITFPLGKNGSYRPALINVTHASASLVTYTAEHFSSSAAALGYTLPGSVDRVSGVRYWIIDRAGAAALTTATVTLHYGVGTNDGVTDPTNLRVVKTNGAGTVWFDAGGTGSAAGTGTITSAAFTTFSTITLGNANGGNNPLPIELKSFEAIPLANAVELKWITASELNNDFFTLERSSDGLKFEAVADIDGKGTIETESRYTYLDRDPIIGRTYYRLKQTDFDKKATYSKIIWTETGLDPKPEVSAFPNPVNTETFIIRLQGYQPGKEVYVKLTDSMGRDLYSGTVPVNSGGRQEIEMQRSGLAPGLYFVTATQNWTKVYFRLIVN